MKRKPNPRRSLLRAFPALLLLGAMALSTAAAADPQPSMAPVNPEFVDFIKKGFRRLTDDGYPLGHIPSPVDLSHVRDETDAGMRTFSYPSSYDLRALNKLTPVKNQGACGSCWAFATYASLESFLKPMETMDFSEQDLNKNHGFDPPECQGGNAYMSLAHLARWSGPLDESDVVYPHKLSTHGPLKHVQQVVFLPPRATALDNEAIKQAVMTDGAVFFAYYHNNNYWNSATSSYHNPVNTNSNHAVAVVGWDDQYNKNNFRDTPPGNGAFIAKNSWGTDWGGGGFFYISYHDTSLQQFVSFNNAEPTTNYDGLYFYDPLGWVTDFGYSSTTAWAANIFTAIGHQALSAVGFITNDSHTAYTIYVYAGVTPGQPRSGTLAATKTGTNVYPGYYTVKLSSPVPLHPGQLFSVVIAYENTSYNYPVPCEYNWAGYSSAATASPGESFLSLDGAAGEWFDLSAHHNANMTIKAFFSHKAKGQIPAIPLLLLGG